MKEFSPFEDKELPAPPLIKKPKANCKNCRGLGSFQWAPSKCVKGGRSYFGAECTVMCPCVKVKVAK
jgi:hypothetical protein